MIFIPNEARESLNFIHLSPRKIFFARCVWMIFLRGSCPAGLCSTRLDLMGPRLTRRRLMGLGLVSMGLISVGLVSVGLISVRLIGLHLIGLHLMGLGLERNVPAGACP